MATPGTPYTFAVKRKNPYEDADGDDREEAGVLWTRPTHSGGLLMTLKVHMMSGETFDVIVDPWFTIARVEYVIREMKGYPQETQQLSIRGRLCVDEHQISRYTNMRITDANLTLVGTSNSSSSSTSNNNTNMAGDGDGNHGYVPGDGNHGLAHEPLRDSDDEATHELLMLLRDQQAARVAAEEEENEESNESDADKESGPNESDEDEESGPHEPEGDESDEPEGDEPVSPHASDTP